KVKYVLLVPLTYNDGSQVSPEVMHQLEADLLTLGGGYTIAGTVKGAYRMQDGSKQVDESLQVWVVIDEQDGPALRELVARLGSNLGQESMYLEQTTSIVEFIPTTLLGETEP
ncbi:MAG: hypothetical protein WEH44_04340, partial [Pirellulaceae bacterium]